MHCPGIASSGGLWCQQWGTLVSAVGGFGVSSDESSGFAGTDIVHFQVKCFTRTTLVNKQELCSRQWPNTASAGDFVSSSKIPRSYPPNPDTWTG
jgi:hypothetical protein